MSVDEGIFDAFVAKQSHDVEDVFGSVVFHGGFQTPNKAVITQIFHGKYFPGIFWNRDRIIFSSGTRRYNDNHHLISTILDLLTSYALLMLPSPTTDFFMPFLPPHSSLLKLFDKLGKFCLTWGNIYFGFSARIIRTICF